MNIRHNDGENRIINHDVYFILDRLRSAHNVGNIFRIADAIGAKEILTCGYTASPPHPKLEKTAMGAERFVKCKYFETSIDAIDYLQKKEIFVIGIETLDNAPSPWEIELPRGVAFIIGNEALGIEPKALAKCDAFVQLPMFGHKNSINVSNCLSAVVYSLLPKIMANHNSHK